MFGMTKRQFLKRSKKCMIETGNLLLLIRQIMDKEIQGKIDNQEALRQMNNIRKNIESLFEEFEKRSPPSSCASLKKRILHALINLNEAVIINYESLLAAKKGNAKESKEKLKESKEILEEFRKDFHSIIEDVDTLLHKKQRRVL